MQFFDRAIAYKCLQYGTKHKWIQTFLLLNQFMTLQMFVLYIRRHSNK